MADTFDTKVLINDPTIEVWPIHVIQKQVELCRLCLHDTVESDAHLRVGGQVLAAAAAATNRSNFDRNVKSLFGKKTKIYFLLFKVFLSTQCFTVALFT